MNSTKRKRVKRQSFGLLLRNTLMKRISSELGEFIMAKHMFLTPRWMEYKSGNAFQGVWKHFEYGEKENNLNLSLIIWVIMVCKLKLELPILLLQVSVYCYNGDKRCHFKVRRKKVWEMHFWLFVHCFKCYHTVQFIVIVGSSTLKKWKWWKRFIRILASEYVWLKILGCPRNGKLYVCRYSICWYDWI